MTIQFRLKDSNGTTTRTYRQVYKGVNLADYRQSFEGMRDVYDSGEMIQLKGNGRVKLASFGKEER